MPIILKNKETLQYKNFYFKCVIGKKGLTLNKKEGDKRTPRGLFGIDKLYFRKDRIKKINTKIKSIPIRKNMGWCDDATNTKKYNRQIKISKKIKHEKMYRKDSNYDLVIPIKYNFLKPKLGKGSAIFLHTTKHYKPTAGCIAISKNDFLILLRLINKKTKIKIS
jgi:L,D-peptidoglycan transpeptidase YkuD (ErfK/YbiS/YcfS/YnhG family)